MEVVRRVGDVHLVSVDSMQVYRTMDIGTAKPTPADQAVAPHHLIDLVDPNDDFTVARFKSAYTSALDTIGTLGGRALLVGGTGLYHRVVIDDFDLPGEWPDVRSALERNGPTESLHHRLGALDPLGAARIEPSNRRRVIRALEVTVGSGRPFSSFGPGLGSYPPTAVTQIGIRWPRPVLVERISDRVLRMIELGLIDEVAAIGSASGFSRTSGQALGYKEIIEHIDGRTSQDEAVDKIITRTRQFAVRQERWFRRDPRVRWIDVDDDPVAEVAPAVIDALRSTTSR